jgi:lysophospholipase L1-like esterase
VARGLTVFEFSKPVDTLNLRFEQTDTLTQRSFTLRGIDLASDDPGIYYHASGVNGAATWSWLRCQRLEEELALLKPDLVVFSIGINDAHDPDFCASCYEKNYEKLIAHVRNVNPDAAILLVTNSDSYRKRRYPVRNADDVRDVMMRLGRKHGTGVWDLYGVMGGQGSIRLWQRKGLAKRDLIHFTRQGYTMVGDLMFTAIMKAYGEHVATGRTP